MMLTPLAPQDAYNIQNNGAYQPFENGGGSLTDEIAYRVLGEIAFNRVSISFPAVALLRVCDVGCYRGASSARWLKIAQKQLVGCIRVQVLGTDIYESNIQESIEYHKGIADLQFRSMVVGGELPRIDENRYHLVFAAFVFDTIALFEDVSILCRRMVEALETQGEGYMLCLHPNALKSSAIFSDYQFEARESRSNWQHGDPLNIVMRKADGSPHSIKDTYWEPGRITEIFTALGCEANLLKISPYESQSIAAHLAAHLEQYNLPLVMPEWQEPLYQIIQVKKQ